MCMLAVVIIGLCGVMTVNCLKTCPDCCTCRRIKNETHLSCRRLPLSIPNDTTHFVLEPIEDIYPTRFNFTHPSWYNVKSLYLLGDTETHSFPKEIFHGVPNLEVLRLSNYHYVRRIPIRTLSHLRKLKVLDLSDNYGLSLSGLSSVLQDLKNLSVESLNLSRINDYDKGLSLTILGNDFLMEAGNLTLKVIDVSWTGRIFLDIGGATKNEIPHFPNLEVLNVSNSFFTYLQSNLPLAADLGRFDIMFPTMQEFVYEGASIGAKVSEPKSTCTKKLSVIQHDTYCEKYSNLRNDDIFLPPLLESLNLDGSDVSRGVCIELSEQNSVCIDKNNSLKYISFKDAGVTGFNIVLSGLNELRTFDLRNNRLSFIAGTSLRYLPNLKQLLLGSNQLWKYQNNVSFENLLNYCSELRAIDLSANNLSLIPRFMFHKNVKLQIIDLAHNHLSTISFKMSHLPHLKILDLSTNVISIIPESVVQYIKSLSFQVPFIDISKNRITCSCHSKTFIETLNDISEFLIDFQSYQCSYEGRIVDLHSIGESTLNKDCVLAVLSVALPVVCSIVSVVFLTVILYQKRIYFIKMYVICRFWRYRKRLVYVKDRIFLAYSHHDKDLVLSRIYPELNEKLRRLLGTDDDVLYINDKDFALPGLIDEEIVAAVSSCKCTVALISRQFLKSSWSHLEVSYSWTMGRPIILVLLEDINKHELHGLLRYLYGKNVRLVWPKNGNEENVFWPYLLQGLFKILAPTRRRSLEERLTEDHDSEL